MALDAEANFASPGGNANYPSINGEEWRERGWNRTTLDTPILVEGTLSANTLP